CKALSNYMCSLLKAAGIKAYYTLVHAGEEKDDRYMVEDFPSHQFNHVIVSIPFPKDTMWLECTDQKLPAGYMSAFTCNRKALMITENGGVLVSTPKYGIKDNLQTHNINGKIDEEGNLNFKVNSVYKAIEQDDIYSIINVLSKENVKKFLNKEFDLSTYDINDFKYDIKKTALPEVDEELDITVANYASVSGKRIFFFPNILNRNKEKILLEESRTSDYVFEVENKEEDSISVEVPAGYQVEAAPKDFSIKNKFGSYSITSKMEGNKIIYHRLREQYAGRFSTSEGEQIAKFYADMYKYDHSRFVLVKKEG
ncbi:MAG TPA: hypothetical protein VGO09_11800, partial [Flavisolibacter sp.]|nr:hypothetical protein [Flavisolibacter sp.]